MRNYEQNGIEIYFDKKPSESVRDSLKGNGWRWSGFKKCWYNYYSDRNLAYAETICSGGMSVGSPTRTTTSTVKPKPQVTPTVRIQEKKKLPFEENDRVSVTLESGKIYLGRVDAYLESSKSVLVTYYLSIDAYSKEEESDIFDEKSVKKTPTVYKSSVEEDTVVRFFIDGMIETGIISSVWSFNDTYDICRYDVDSLGNIEEVTDSDIPFECIYEVERTKKVFPLKVGDKVEYYNDDDEWVIAKITYVNSDRTVDVEYSYIDSWGDKETQEDSYVNIDRIRVIKQSKGTLDRRSFISSESQKCIDVNETVLKRIRDKADEFYDTRSIVQNNKLYRHQKAGTYLAEIYNKFAFFYDTGTGKTVMALDIIASKTKKDNARFLIIAPKSIIKTAWMDDALKYYPNMHILPLYNGFNTRKKRNLLNSWKTQGRAAYWESDPVFYAHVRLISDLYDLGEIKVDNDAAIDETLSSLAQHYIINSEMFIRNPEYYIDTLGITGIVMDESAILKNYNGKTAKVMREISERMKYVYLLSGKPAPNNIIEYFSQMKIVDPETFSMSYERFLGMFCYSSYNKYYMYPENKNLFAEMVSIKSLIVAKTDCLDLPGTVDVVRQIELSDDIMRDYNELYEECMTIIKGMDNSQTFYSAQSKLAILMKLRQMASGFFMMERGGYKENKIIVDIHNSKIQELNNIIDQIEEEQVIIWCQFQHEIEIVAEELSKRGNTVTAYGKTKDLERNIDEFKQGKAQYIVAHPKTLKYGVTFTNCKYTIYYSFSYSAEDYDQSHDRNYRLGQTEMCTYIYIQAADTIDEIMYEKVMNKLSNAEFFEKLIKDAAKHGIDYDSLKAKSDSDIRASLSKEDGGIESLTRDIVRRSQDVSRTSRESDTTAKGYTTYDYLEKIEGPTESELLWLEKNFIPRKFTQAELDVYPYLEGFLFDTSRSDYFDFVHAEESYIKFSRNMSEEDFRIFLTYQSEEDRWVYEMYRDVYKELVAIGSINADLITDKYGIEDGKKRSNATIADKMRRTHYSEYGYTWNTARVAEELKEGMYSLYHRGTLRRYADKIRKVFMDNA